ncbi:MAG: hypothetical protein M3015_17780 [Bacteroidota bacterium]|nr:hypothetical protein [Bacteroidota bacterium]
MQVLFAGTIYSAETDPIDSETNKEKDLLFILEDNNCSGARVMILICKAGRNYYVFTMAPVSLVAGGKEIQKFINPTIISRYCLSIVS